MDSQNTPMCSSNCNTKKVNIAKIDIRPLVPNNNVIPRLDKHIYNYINFASPIFRSLKENKLRRYVDKYSALPVQGTDEWLEARKLTIGGSEIATVIGHNNYCSYANWIAEKVGLISTRFEGNTATRFGKLFENIGARLTQLIFNTTLHEMSSIEGTINGIKYSPDGIGIIKFACFDIINNKPVLTVEYMTTLLEFKSPLTTIPNGKIPRQYLPQIMTGLATLEVETGLFVNNMYRKCSFDNFKANLLYDRDFHKKDKDNVAIAGIAEEKPFAMGIIYFYTTAEQFEYVLSKLAQACSERSAINQYLNIDIATLTAAELDCIVEDDNAIEETGISEIETDVGETDIENDLEYSLSALQPPPIDFGKKGSSFEELLWLLYVSKNIITPVFDDIYINKEKVEQIPFISAQVEALREKNQYETGQEYPSLNDIPKTHSDILNTAASTNIGLKNKFIGYLPWKLVKSDIISVAKDPNYLSNYEEIIRSTFSILTHINKQPTVELKREKYDEYFDKRKINNGCEHKRSHERN